MPRNTREYLIRYYTQVMNNQERTLEKLKQMADTYGDIKPQHREYLENVAVMVVNVQNLMEQFRRRFM